MSKNTGLLLVGALALMGVGSGRVIPGVTGGISPPSVEIVPTPGAGRVYAQFDRFVVNDLISIRFWDSPPNDYVVGASITAIETGGNYGDGSPALITVNFQGREKTFSWNSFMQRSPDKL